MATSRPNHRPPTTQSEDRASKKSPITLILYAILFAGPLRGTAKALQTPDCNNGALRYEAAYYLSALPIPHDLSLDSDSFRVMGADHPGVVHKVTKALAAHGLSIDRLRATADTAAPHGDTTLFCIQCIATCAAPLPASFDVGQIQEELEELGDAMNCEVTLEDSVDETYGNEVLAG